MTEEERQKTILELEQEVLGYKSKSQPRVCEVCGNKLIKGGEKQLMIFVTV